MPVELHDQVVHDHGDGDGERISVERHRGLPATRDLARCLRPLVQQLPPRYRDAVTRVDLDGQTHARAADELGTSVSGMTSRVQRGRRQLKQLLTGCCAVHQDHAGAVRSYQPAHAACGCSSG